MAEPETLAFREWLEAKRKARKPSVVPTDVAEILGRAPLLDREDRDWYEDTRAKFAAVIKPEDCIVWMFVEDFAYHTTEIYAFGGLKANRIDAARQYLLFDLISEPIKQGKVKFNYEIDELIKSYFLSAALRDGVEYLFGIDLDSLTAKAYAEMADEMAAFDKSIASSERSRMKVLREIELRRVLVARRLH